MKFFVAALITTALSTPAWAVKTLSVKGDRALLDLEGEDIQVGDKIGARNSEGKARALLEIKQVKNGKAVAAVVKGQLTPDLSLAKLGTASAAKNKAGGTKSSRTKTAPSKSSWGLTAGYAMSDMTVKATSTASVSMTGSSFNLSGYYQMPLDGRISTRLFGSYETLDVKGTAPASLSGQCGSECKATISYLGLMALVRYSFLVSPSYEAWAGGGLGFLFAIGKSSTILDTSKISTNQTIIGSLGLDYRLDKKSYIPIQFDYAMFPDNSTSSAKQMILRAGWGFQF